MLRKGFRPRAVYRKRFRPRVVPLIVVIVAVVVYVAVQLLRPGPAMTMTPSPAPLRALPGVPPSAAWPGQGQAAVGMPGVGMLATHGGNQPMAIASVAKIMTAYIVLRDHPLQMGEAGPAITVSAADVAAYDQDKSQGQSVSRWRRARS